MTYGTGVNMGGLFAGVASDGNAYLYGTYSGNEQTLNFTMGYTSGTTIKRYKTKVTLKDTSKDITIVWHGNGGTINGLTQYQVDMKSGGRLAYPSTPVRGGYSFIGWYSTSNSTNYPAPSDGSLVWDSADYYAQWDAVPVPLTDRPLIVVDSEDGFKVVLKDANSETDGEVTWTASTSLIMTDGENGTKIIVPNGGAASANVGASNSVGSDTQTLYTSYIDVDTGESSDADYRIRRIKSSTGNIVISLPSGSDVPTAPSGKVFKEWQKKVDGVGNGTAITSLTVTCPGSAEVIAIFIDEADLTPNISYTNSTTGTSVTLTNTKNQSVVWSTSSSSYVNFNPTTMVGVSTEITPKAKNGSYYIYAKYEGLSNDYRVSVRVYNFKFTLASGESTDADTVLYRIQANKSPFVLDLTGQDIPIPTAPTGKRFKGWAGSDGTIVTTVSTNSTVAVTVTAQFEDIPASHGSLNIQVTIAEDNKSATLVETNGYPIFCTIPTEYENVATVSQLDGDSASVTVTPNLTRSTSGSCPFTIVDKADSTNTATVTLYFAKLTFNLSEVQGTTYRLGYISTDSTGSITVDLPDPPSPPTGKAFRGWKYGSSKYYTTTVPLARTGSATLTATYGYTVTISATEGGTVSPSGEKVLASDESLTVTASPATNYTFKGWEIDDRLYEGNDMSYTFSAITKNQTITGVFQSTVQPISVTIAATTNDGTNSISNVCITQSTSSTTNNLSVDVTGITTAHYVKRTKYRNDLEKIAFYEKTGDNTYTEIEGKIYYLRIKSAAASKYQLVDAAWWVGKLPDKVQGFTMERDIYYPLEYDIQINAAYEAKTYNVKAYAYVGTAGGTLGGGTIKTGAGGNESYTAGTDIPVKATSSIIFNFYPADSYSLTAVSKTTATGTQNLEVATAVTIFPTSDTTLNFVVTLDTYDTIYLDVTPVGTNAYDGVSSADIGTVNSGTLVKTFTGVEVTTERIAVTRSTGNTYGAIEDPTNLGTYVKCYARTGYVFDDFVNLNGTSLVSMDEYNNEYIYLRNLTSDLRIYARFKLKQFNITFSPTKAAGESSEGYIRLKKADGSFVDTSPATVDYGSTPKFVYVSNKGYDIDYWVVTPEGGTSTEAQNTQDSDDTKKS